MSGKNEMIGGHNMEKSHIVKLPMFQVSQIDSWKTLKPDLLDPCLAIVTWELSYINIWLSFISLISGKKNEPTPPPAHTPCKTTKCHAHSSHFVMICCCAVLPYVPNSSTLASVALRWFLWTHSEDYGKIDHTNPMEKIPNLILKNVCIFHAIYCGHLFENHVKHILILLLGARILTMVSSEAEVIPSVYI